MPMFSWTGCYIGGSIGGGYAWTENTNAVNTTAFGDFGPGQGYANHASGFAGGGQLGCNYQVSRFVIGVEGSYLWANIKRDYVSPFGGGDDVYTNKIDGIASVAARFGMAFDNWLFYTKAGWAAAHAKLSVVDNIPATGAGSASNWHNGFTVGTGTEYAFTPNWIVGFETQLLPLREQELRDRRRRRLVYVQLASARHVHVPRTPELQVRLGCAGRGSLLIDDRRSCDEAVIKGLGSNPGASSFARHRKKFSETSSSANGTRHREWYSTHKAHET